ncbi:MAG TPA: hypothetical protein VFA07_01145 [Chthonomonadaceae bacterium]|nr:hypothetical protein [Chthonomonadaceae bacterium]
MFDWDAELPAERRDALIEKMAQFVSRRGLHVPAIFFLEMHKPLTYLASQSLILGSGFLAPFFGPQNVQQVAKLFEKRDNVERLIRRIEDIQAGPPPETQEVNG